MKESRWKEVQKSQKPFKKFMEEFVKALLKEERKTKTT